MESFESSSQTRNLRRKISKTLIIVIIINTCIIRPEIVELSGECFIKNNR